METFRRGLWGWIQSSDGYAIRLLARARLQYRDALGFVEMFAESTSQPWTETVVDTLSIPDGPVRSRNEVVDRLQRALDFVGWTLVQANRGETDTEGNGAGFGDIWGGFPSW